MYCAKCGVELAKGEEKCPLCGLKAYHPELGENEGKKSYPTSRVPSLETLNKKGILLLFTFIFAVPIIVSLICDLEITGSVSWSGYVVGGIVLMYLVVVLPSWFNKPNPVIFLPVFFAGVTLYLHYINFATSSSWFISFAFPTVGVLAIIVTTFAALLKYVKKGYWFIAASGVFAVGCYAVLIEFFLYITFNISTHIPWSLYPFGSCFLIGSALMVIAMSKPLRRRVQKKFFI